MKDFMGKLKNLNYKELVIDHAEKISLVLVGILVLTSLACTRWGRYDKRPDEFLAKVEQGESQLKASRWPAEKQTELSSARDLTEAVHRLMSPIDVAKYELPIPFMRPLYPQKQKRKEPVWLPVRDLVADVGTVILEFVPEGTTTDAAGMPLAEADGTASDTSPLGTADGVVPDDTEIVFDDDTAPRSSLPAPAGRGAMGGSPGMSEYEREMAMYAEEDDEEEDDEEMYDEEEEYAMYADSEGEDGYEGAMGPAIRKMNAHGLRYVAVRGVFPLKEQIDSVKKALNIETSLQAEQVIEFLDFVIERQTAQRGDNPWSGEWEALDIQSAVDILTTVTDFDADVVDGSYTDAVFTMPLPRRVAGSWRRVGSHPKIKALTEEEAERQMLINQKAIEKAEELKKQMPQQPGGFASTQVDIRGVRRSLYSSGEYDEVMDEAYKEYSSEDYQPYNPRLGMMRGRPNLAQAAFAGQFEEPSNRLLLFRYLDFAIEPGNAYRYRVHLVVRNPNFRYPPEELLDPDFAVGETRDTPTSEPTAPVIFPNDVNYFLTRISPARTTTAASADFEVFCWYPDSGTLVKGKAKADAGDFIGGPTSTEVLRPEQSFMQEDDVEMTTGDYLLDIVDTPPLPSDTDAHPDLAVDTKQRGGTAMDLAIILDKYGELVSLDQYSRLREHAVQRARLERQNQPWEYLKELSKPKEPLDGDYDEMSEEYSEYAEYMGGESTTKSRRSSRGRSRRSNPSRRAGPGPKSMIPGSYLEQ